MNEQSAVAVWQDPRDLVCVAVGDGQPVALTRDEARELHHVILAACESANADLAANETGCAVTVWQGTDLAVGIDTTRRHVIKKTKAVGRRLALVSITVRGVTTDLHPADAAATALKIGRYAVRAYVRKTIELDPYDGNDGV